MNEKKLNDLEEFLKNEILQLILINITILANNKL